MRLIVMFDLPTKTSADRRNYRKFSKFLQEKGYSMMQYSIYSKIIINRSVLSSQLEMLKHKAPPEGYVEALVITEKQYSNIKVIVGRDTRSKQEHTTKRLIEL